MLQMFCNLSFTCVQVEDLSVAVSLKMQTSNVTQSLTKLSGLRLMDLLLFSCYEHGLVVFNL